MEAPETTGLSRQYFHLKEITIQKKSRSTSSLTSLSILFLIQEMDIETTLTEGSDA